MGYEVRIDGGSPIDIGTALSHIFSALTPSTSHTFEGRTYDAKGNRSPWSDLLSASTTAVVPIPITNIVTDGDSITYGADGSTLATGWPAQLAALWSCDTLFRYNSSAFGTPRNYGDWIGYVPTDRYRFTDTAVPAIGFTVSQGGVDPVTNTLTIAASRVDANLDPRANRNICVLLCGTNDYEFLATEADVKAAFSQYVTDRKNAGFDKVIILTILPRNTSASGFETKRTDTNAWLLAGNSGADLVIDIASDSRLSNTADTTYFNADGIHPNEAGCGVIASLVQTAIDGLGSIGTASPFLLRLNSGGSAVDLGGGLNPKYPMFFNDDDVSLSTWTGSIFDYSDSYNTNSITPLAEGVLDSMRYHATSFTGTVPTGFVSTSFETRMIFAAHDATGTGQFVQNIDIDGTAVESNLDVYSVAGIAMKAVARDHSVMSDGSGDIVFTFTKVAGTFVEDLRAIEIYKA